MCVLYVKAQLKLCDFCKVYKKLKQSAKLFLNAKILQRGSWDSQKYETIVMPSLDDYEV